MTDKQLAAILACMFLCTHWIVWDRPGSFMSGVLSLVWFVIYLFGKESK